MKRKGFTLIELIAVIVILAVIALIAVPIVMNIINKANKSAFKDSIYGIIRATELYYNEKEMMLEPIENDIEYIFPNIGELEIKGNIPSSGNMIISKEGEIAIAASNGRYCVKKGYKDTEVSIEETKEECKTEEIANPILITDIKVKGNIEINVGEKEKVKVEYEPSEATTKELEWTSSDKSIVIVNSVGEIKGIKSGVTTIIVKTTDGSNIRKEINVNVKQPVTKLEVNTSSLSIINGDTYQIITTIEPSNASNKTLSWISSNSSIATVNSSGLITGVKGGTATITVSTTDGSNLNKTIEVTVRQQVTNIILSPTSVTINTGASTSISATVTPDDAFMKGLKWESSNTSIATVSGGTITGVAPGTTTVTATTIDGSNISKSVNVTVKQLITSLTLSQSSVSIDTGKTTTITPTISPGNASNKTLSWNSSNTSVATVNSNGLITGISKGTATITVSTTDGSNISKTVSVTVKQPNPNISSTNTCIKSNTICPNGTLVNVKVNSSDNYDFYVIKDTGTELTLIMNKNLGATIAWINQADYITAGGNNWGSDGNNDKGPLTALKILEQRTVGWSNVPTITYTLTDDGGGNRYQSITRSNVRARMLTYTQATALGCSFGTAYTCPSYLHTNTYDNGDNSNYGYWLSSAHSTKTNSGRNIAYRGDTASNNVYYESNYGVRPVIAISKNL